MRGLSAVRRRRPANAHQATRCHLGALDPSSVWALPVHPTHPDWHPTLSRCFGVDALGTLHHTLPDGPTRLRPRWRGPLSACHEQSDTFVSRRSGQVQAQTELCGGLPRTLHRGCAQFPAGSLGDLRVCRRSMHHGCIFRV